MDKLADITAQGWILAYFIRSDGERFLLGTGAYDFKSDLQHFQPNTMANDIVELQGTDGQLIAGQVRRSATQSFNGYVGDSTQNRERIEELRRDFLMFFRKNFFYKTVYIYPNGTAIQRKRGYLVDAPSVPELYQFFPEYHVALNYEDPNYYEYAEDAYGDEIFANILAITLTTPSAGGLVWDAIGAVSHGYTWSNPQTASGSAFQITGIEGAPLTLTEITGNATQNGTPTPDAPVAVNTTTGENVVKITGKNLLNVSELNGKTVAGLTLSVNGQEIRATGTATSNYGSTSFTPLSVPLKSGSYCFKTNGASIDTKFWGYQTSGGTLDINVASGSSFNVVAPIYYWRFVVEHLTVGQSYDTTFTVQLELGSTATSYEPYQGEDYEVNLGKNLLAYPYEDSNKTVNGITYTDNGDGTITANGTATAQALFWITNETWSYSTSNIVVPAGTYTISKTGDNNYRTIVTVYRKSQGLLTTYQVGENDVSFTTDEESSLTIRLAVQGGTTANNYKFRPMIERGSTATSYAPYFTPIELAKIGTYQDRIYKDEGKWYVEKQTGNTVLNGSENWTESGYTNSQIYSVYGGVPTVAGSPLLSSEFVFNNTVNSGTVTEYVSSYNSAVLRLGVLKSRLQTANMTGFKTWLASNPTTVYYTLATPTTTEITDSTLLAQLNFIANLYGGTNNIMLVGTGAQGEIEVQYMTEVDTDGAGYEWEGGGGGGNTITLDAVEAVRPVWQVVGPATNPTLTNITTGETISFDGTVPAGQTLTVDMDARTATMAGANVFQFITGDWLRLEPGNNRISYTATGTTEPSTLSWNGVVG